mgnify:CR=1 FL=1|jgi:alginate O-acetyltransferase complex protein AlgI
MLLVSSYVFYGWWDWRFLSLIAFSTIIDYAVGLRIESTQQQFIKKKWLYLSIGVNLGLLGIFKYFNFFIDSWVTAFSAFGYEMSPYSLRIILPVGISFYTFQTLSYSIDIYRGKLKPTNDFVAFATFVSFFPQLVAGPIERASHLLPQIIKKRIFKYNDFKSGILQIFVGLVRKVIVADAIGGYISSSMSNPWMYNGTTLAISIALFSFQIYCDFAGYSDIAIGTAKLFGIKLNANFKLPYFSTSITEFWRRWHISLSSWLRDYLYIPLGGNRGGTFKLYRNLLLTMLIGGLWHGSAWTFVIWGGLHGIVLSIEKKFNLVHEQYNIIKNISTFVIVSMIWIFFRANSMNDALLIYSKIIFESNQVPFIPNTATLAMVLWGLVMMFLIDSYLYRKNINLEVLGESLPLIKFVTFIAFMMVNLFLFQSNSLNFIYFQF